MLIAGVGRVVGNLNEFWLMVRKIEAARLGAPSVVNIETCDEVILAVEESK